MINAVNTTLDCRPQSLTGINVGDTGDVLLGGVLDNGMGVSEFLNPVVAGQFIGKDDGFIFFGRNTFFRNFICEVCYWFILWKYVDSDSFGCNFIFGYC